MIHKEEQFPYRWLFTGLAFILAVFIALLGKPIAGLNLLFLLPLAFAAVSALAGDLFKLWRKGIGYLVLFLVLILRYLVSPLLIALSGQTVVNITASQAGLHFSIFIMCAELFVLMATLWWTQRRKNIPAANDSALAGGMLYRNSIHGLVFFLLILIMLILRGNLGNVFSQKSFALWISRDRTPLATYDLELVLVLKAVLLVAACAWTVRVLKTSKNKLLRAFSLVGVVIAAALNMLWYYHPNRSVMVYAVSCSTAVMMFSFPKAKRPILILGVIVIMTLAGSNVLMRTLQLGNLQLTPQDLVGQQLTPQDLVGQQLTPQDLAGQQLTPQGLDGQQPTPQGLAGQQLTPQDLDGQQLAPQGPDGQRLTMQDLDTPLDDGDLQMMAWYAAALNKVSKIGELYSNGVSTMAHSYDMAEAIHQRVSFATFLHDMVRYLRFFSYPVLRNAYSWFEGSPTTAAMFLESLGGLSYIMPNYGLASFWLGKYAGIVLDLLFHAAIVLFMDFFVRRRQHTAHNGYRYVLTYCEVICGITLLNNVGLMLGQLSGLPLLLYVVFWSIDAAQKRLTFGKATS